MKTRISSSAPPRPRNNPFKGGSWLVFLFFVVIVAGSWWFFGSRIYDVGHDAGYTEGYRKGSAEHHDWVCGEGAIAELNYWVEPPVLHICTRDYINYERRFCELEIKMNQRFGAC